MSNPVSPLITEIKTLADKVLGQGVAFAGYYAIVVHTDFTKIETAAGAAVAALVGYTVNKLRGIKL